MKFSPIVKFDNHGVSINGEYKVLLCASLFYFRIPRELWRDRITKIKKIGYNCVDVYFPWNFHELSPDMWDFSGQRNVEEFLTFLAEEQMFVIARPGPYICSEWDGGAIPAWVLAGSYDIRESNKNFIDKVEKWYSKILPIIAKYQFGRDGTVISVQLDNELDFFDCPDPKAYMSELRDMALSKNITVPLFGCAGQGCAERATGLAPDIEIAFNFYPDSKDPAFEELCLAAYKRMKSIGKPLLVTETNRDGLTLRRELACGVKLLGAYNQVGGTNFGFTNAVNNWGKGTSPFALITSDYDFKSNISPAGEFDENVLEGRLISALISTLGESLACSETVLDHGFEIKASFLSPMIGFSALKLKDGGWLINIPNIGGEIGTVSILGNQVDFSIIVEPSHAPFFPVGIPLEKWHVKGSIEWASAEIAHIYEDCETVHIIMYSNQNGTAVLRIPGVEPLDDICIVDDKVVVSGIVTSRILKQGNKTIQISIVNSEQASRYEIHGSRWETEIPTPTKAVTYNGNVGILRNADIWPCIMENVRIAPLEFYRLWRGFGLYRIHTVLCRDILLKGAGDVISAYNDGEYIDTRISGCQWQLYSGRNNGEWSFRTEIWGHSNFDDSRMEGMKLKSAKGIAAVFNILKTEDISSWWSFDYFEGNVQEALKKPLGGFEPLLNLNSWNTTKLPVQALYRRRILLESGCDSLILKIEGNAAAAEVYVDGNKVSEINRLDPYIDLSDFVTFGKEIEIAIAAVKKDWSEPIGQPILLHSNRIANCDLSFLHDFDVTHVMNTEVESTSFPVSPEPGEVMILSLDLDLMEKGCAYARLDGRNVKITAAFNDNIVGRIFLEGDNRPFMTGGDQFRFYLPGPWFNESGNKLNLLVEAIGNTPIINGIFFEYIR